MQCILENVEALFHKMKDNGWNMNTPHKWSFYFYNQTANSAKLVFKELEDHSYNLETIKKLNGQWRLEVSKVDILTPIKLHKRNIAFNELAEYFGSDYDGWDVETVEKSVS